MTRNLMIQLPEDQFLHWRQDMEKKQEEQARKMMEQRENECLWPHIEKRHDIGERDVQDSGQAKHSTARDKGKEPIVPNNVDTPAYDELSSGSSPNLSLAKSSRVRSRQRHSHRPTFSNADNGTFCRARKETGRGQNQPN